MLTSILVDKTNLQLAVGYCKYMQYRATKNAYFYSYFTRTISEWYALPETIVEADSLALFQSGMRDYLDSD